MLFFKFIFCGEDIISLLFGLELVLFNFFGKVVILNIVKIGDN